MRVALATSAGHPGRPNEDFVGAVPSAVVLLDGAGIPDTEAICRHGVAWYAHSLGGRLLSHLSRDTEEPLTEVLALGIERRHRVAPRHLRRDRPEQSAGDCCPDAHAGSARRVAGPRRRLRRPRPRRRGRGADRPGRAGGPRRVHGSPRRARARLSGVQRRPAQRDRRPAVAPEPKRRLLDRQGRPGRGPTRRDRRRRPHAARRRARPQQRRAAGWSTPTRRRRGRTSPGWLGSTVRTSCSPRSGPPRSDSGPPGGPDDATIAVCTL